MKQVFIDQNCDIDSKIVLNDQEAHHLFDVLRIQKKEIVRVVAQDGRVFLAHPSKRPYLDIFSEIEVPRENKHITLCVSLIKQDKFEWMLQKACELNVTRIVPFESRYSVVHIDANKEQKKLDRWSQIILSACKQCNRNDLVELMPIQRVENLHEFQSDCNLVAYEKENESSHISKYLKSNPKSITICIGPEGGFDPAEIDILNDDHFQCVSLGKSILRAETACLFCLACIEYQKYLEEDTNEI
ncbi:MAG: RsmE family RNA methyltransferase [Floccifex sp.]